MNGPKCNVKTKSRHTQNLERFYFQYTSLDTPDNPFRTHLSNSNIDTPIVFFLMSVYTGECSLLAAVESTHDQNFRELEFIIINEGSTDFSAAMLDSYHKNDLGMRVYHQENRDWLSLWTAAVGWGHVASISTDGCL